MGIYAGYVLPKLIHHACGMKPYMKQREKVVPLARGRVLEIGVGSGLNLPFYDADRVEHLWALDPSPELLKMARSSARQSAFPTEFVLAPGEAIPLADDSADAVVVTYTLCTIPDVPAALQEIRRVLRKGGSVLFCEHGLAPDAGVRKWQHRLNRPWKALAGGCHLNRYIPQLLNDSGLAIRSLETMYLPGWKPAAFNYWGEAAAV